ncbi:MAG: ASCH domain-containing protein [Chloroflexales bacterium]
MKLLNPADLWDAFAATLPPDAPQRAATFIVDSFGDSPALADELGALVVQGVKTATCSAVWEWESRGEALPHVGLFSVVLDGAGQPWCIIETTEVTIRAFSEVDAALAYDEGEGDRTLAYWRTAHQRYFGRVLPPIGRTLTDATPLVCERFRLVYPLP